MGAIRNWTMINYALVISCEHTNTHALKKRIQITKQTRARIAKQERERVTHVGLSENKNDRCNNERKIKCASIRNFFFFPTFSVSFLFGCFWLFHSLEHSANTKPNLINQAEWIEYVNKFAINFLVDGHLLLIVVVMMMTTTTTMVMVVVVVIIVAVSCLIRNLTICSDCLFSSSAFHWHSFNSFCSNNFSVDKF